MSDFDLLNELKKMVCKKSFKEGILHPSNGLTTLFTMADFSLLNELKKRGLYIK